jgi:hypothetical protein
LESSLASADSSNHNKFKTRARSRRRKDLDFRRKKRTPRPCFYTVSLQTLEREPRGKIFDQISISLTLFLGKRKSTKNMSNNGGRKDKRKVELYDDETPRRRVNAKKTCLTDRLGTLGQGGDTPALQVVVINNPTIAEIRSMALKIDRIGRGLLPSDDIGPPGCKLGTITINLRWMAIERIKSLDTFQRIIFYCDLTDDVFFHPRFIELYGDPLTRFLPQRSFHFDQPFDHKSELNEANEKRRMEYLKRTFNRLFMLADGNRISTIMMVCHPFMYTRMLGFNPSFDAAPQAKVECDSIREIFFEVARATDCKHYHDIKLGNPGRTTLMAEFKRRPYVLRQSRMADDLVKLLPGVGPERVVEVEKIVEVPGEQVFIEIVPKSLKKMIQDLVNVVSLAPKMAQELLIKAESITERVGAVQDEDDNEMDRGDDNEMDREDDPELEMAEAPEEDLAMEHTPKVPHDNLSDNSPLIPRLAEQTASVAIGLDEYDWVSTASTSRQGQREAATAGRQKSYQRLGVNIKGLPPPKTYDVQVLNGQTMSAPLEGGCCPDFREGLIVHARDSSTRKSQSMHCNNWRCLAKDPQHLREDGTDPTTDPYIIRRAQDVLDTLSLTSGRFFIKDKTMSWIVNYGKGSQYEKWPDAMKRLRELNFFRRILGDCWMTFDVEGIIDGIKQSFIDSGKCTFEDTKRAFSVVHQAVPYSKYK